MTKAAISSQKPPHLRLVGGASGVPPTRLAPIVSTITVAEPVDEPVSATRVAHATARINEGDAISSEMVRLVEMYGRIDEGSARDLVRSLVALIANTEDGRDPGSSNLR
ncbi:MAG: hypothetical protein MUF14_06915 [Hyphomonadaceae bacterium]|jgi:hypothetical protein|nr:hypothetical protein [Hyphomonadaceae bacterium]